MFKIVKFLAMGASKCNLFIAKKKKKPTTTKKQSLPNLTFTDYSSYVRLSQCFVVFWFCLPRLPFDLQWVQSSKALFRWN